jgi:hypothetical protein
MTRLYVTRDADGQIAHVTSDPQAEGAEPARLEDTDVQRYLAGLDLDLVRVLEDVIDLLVSKGVFHFTDLPEAAQQKLLHRKSVRRQWRSLENPLSGDEEIF